MAVKESRLSIVVDSMSAQQQIDGLRARLRTLEEAGLSVSQSMNTACTSTGNAGQKAQSASSEINKLVAEMRANAAATAELTKNVLGMNNSIDKLATSTLREGQRQTKAFTDALNNLNKTSKASSETTANANDSLENQSEALNRLVNQIDPVIARMDRLDQQEEQLRAHFKNGIVDPTTFDTLKAKIDQSRESLGRFGNSSRSAASAGRTLARETEMVAPQLTDIFTSLVSGEPAYMVAIQQGGQLRDMFGGIGEAGAATGRVLLSMINPVTALGAVAIAMGAAWYSAEKRLQSFQNVAAKTNNYSGNGNQLLSVANNVGDSTGNYSGADQAVTALASTGQVAYSQLQTLADAVTRSNQATGQSVSDLVDQYTKIMGDPVNALINLNNQYHSLSASQILHVQQLQEEGRQQDAVNQATSDWAEASNRASSQVEANMLAIQKAARGVKHVLEDAWQGLGNFFTNSASQFSETIGKASEADLLRNAHTNLSAGSKLDDLSQGEQFALQQEQVNKFMSSLGQTQDQLNNAASNGMANIIKVANQYESTTSKISRETKELKSNLDAVLAAPGMTAAKRQQAIAEYNQALAGIRSQQHTPHPRANHTAQNQAIELFMRERQAVTSLIQPYNKLDVAQAKYQGQLSDINRAVKEGSINEIEATVARVNAAAAYDKVADSIHSTSDRLKEYQATLDAQRTTQQQQNMLQVAGVGMGSQEFQRAQQLLQTQQQFQQQVTQLEQQRSQTSDPKQQNYITGEITAQRKMMELTLGDQQDMYKQLDAMQSNWKNGAESAWEDFQDQAANTASLTKSLFSDAFDQATDSLATFARTGKLNFSNLTQSVIADLTKVAAEKGLSSLLSLAGFSFGGPLGASAISSFGSVAGGSDLTGGMGGINALLGSGGGSIFSSVGHLFGHLFADGGYTGDGSKYQPAGIVHKGEGVIKSEVMRQPGMRNFLDNLNRGYAQGGYVGNGSSSNAPAPISGGTVVNIHPPSGHQARQTQSRNNMGQDVLDIWFEAAERGDTRINGPMERRYGLSRRGN